LSFRRYRALSDHPNPHGKLQRRISCADRFGRWRATLGVDTVTMMKSPDGATVSAWYPGVEVPKFSPPRETRFEADVCVVGAGISGLTAAYLLAKEGKSVIVVDEGDIAGGQTGRTSAHLSSALDERFTEIERMHGQKNAALAYQSHAAAIDEIERIVTEEKIDCEFARVDGFLTAAPSDPSDTLQKERDAAARAGVADLELLPAGGIGDAPCLRFGKQAQFQPLQYCFALARIAADRGVRFALGRRAHDVQGSDPKTGAKAKVTLAGTDGSLRTITANHVLVATNTPAPINDWFGIYTKQAAYRSYVIAAEIPKDSVPDALHWDTVDPYHYVRIEKNKGSDLLIIGGADHKVGQLPKNAAPFGQLETWGRKYWPMMGEIKFRWSGQVQEPADGLAFIGRALTEKQEVFVITGDSGMGLTHGTLGAMLVRDLIFGRINPWESLYDPARKISNAQFIKENANVLKEYVNYLTPGEYPSVDEIPKGQGGVLRDGLKKIAVYRDDDGNLHKRSAVCTHLACIVQWNPIEKTWDCPCHGGRFDCMGKVLMGPPVDDLGAAR
jgi:glycine/D-amino acid oxidase-like deaminating enzyme/nitrite reductase/ring-hydroxylating ferredoxin subunit